MWAFNKKRVDPSIMCARTMALLEEYIVANSTECEVSPISVSYWRRESMEGSTSDAVLRQDGMVGLGVIVRYHVGDVLVAASRRMKVDIPVIHAEVLAVRFYFACRWPMKQAFDRLIEVEVDNLNLANLLHTRQTEKSVTQVMVNDICSFVKSFYACSFYSAKGSCNKVAHTMAKNSLTFEEDLIWLEECPQNVSTLVLEDKGNLE